MNLGLVSYLENEYVPAKTVVIDCGLSGREFGVGLNHGVPHKIQNAMPSNDRACSRADRVMPSCKTIGVQTEEAGDPAQVTLDDDPPACHALSEKLLAIWGSPSDQNLGRNLISKLLVTCQADLHVLFGFMSRNVSRSTRDPVADGSSTDVALKLHMHSFHTSEAARVSHLYSVLTKISDGVVPLESLFEPLLDLCSLENVVIVHRSLRILHGFLKYLLSLERKFEKRDNVIVEELCSGNNAVDGHGSDSSLLGVIINETSYAGCTPLGIIVPDAESPCKRETWSHDIAISVSRVDWVSLVEFMHQIVMKNAEECVRLEAVSVMNVILIESEAYIDREKFGQKMFFESLSQLLRKEAGLRVQKHAVHLLHLLFNSFGSLFNEGPKLLAMFCSGCNEGTDDALDDNARPQKFINVLHGLADCVTCRGNGLQELTLCRNAVIVLAFLASSGKPGFEILVSPKLYREANFLMLILQVLVSEMDIEAAAFAEPPEIFKERFVSNPAYSVSGLRVLTNSRDMASLTIYIANRLSRKDQRHGQPDSMIRQMRESEIVNLAQVFKKRVFTYLGDSIT
ncbi:hypothetical protein CJ030_MR4G026753 [Morella rubra]|uniref:Uncharacterized protein n=1 Tax=Morella rubra TaxID=262757 RepID=A0A6A1VTT9_9ROSI|nr:hypothetical protein CJ030_MR4G026753 [Morella rubra]